MNSPLELVKVDLGDGVQRELRYSMGSMRRLKKQFGASLLTGEGLRSVDEDKFPEMLFEGLVDKDGIATADELADRIPVSRYPDLMKSFCESIAGSMPVPKPVQGDAVADPNAPSSQAT